MGRDPLSVTERRNECSELFATFVFHGPYVISYCVVRFTKRDDPYVPSAEVSAAEHGSACRESSHHTRKLVVVPLQ